MRQFPAGKMAVLGCMLALLRPTGERIVVVSNSTQVLDLIGQLCRERSVRTPACAALEILVKTVQLRDK